MISFSPYQEVMKQVMRKVDYNLRPDEQRIISQGTQKKQKIVKNSTRYHRKKSSTLHLEHHEFTQRSLALTPTNGRPLFRHIGLLAGAGSSWPLYPPGRQQVVAPNGLTRGENIGRKELRVNVPWCSILQFVSTYIRVRVHRRPRWLVTLSSCLLKSISRVQFSPSAHTNRDFFLGTKIDQR